MSQSYSAQDQALIDQVNAEYEARSGKDRLWGWFGLSRASFLVLPRVLMHEMPDDWQKRMAVLLEQYEATFDDGFDGTVSVIGKKGNRYVAIPEWLRNYRRPDHERIAAATLPASPLGEQ